MRAATQCVVGFQEGEFPVCFWGRSGGFISLSAHRVALKGWWDFNKRKKCIFIELLISTRHHGKDLACYRKGSQIGLEVREAVPEKLASASLILTIITWGCCASVICLWWTGRLIYAQLVIR